MIEAINPEEYLEQPSTFFPNTKKKTAGGSLTNNVQPGAVLPNSVAAYRQKESELYRQGSEMYNSEPDMSQFQEYARQRGEQGNAALLNAIAAQFAGADFQPIQAHYLKRAAAAQDPMKMGSGLITADGRYLKDPEVAQNKKAEFLLAQAKAYGQMALNAETVQQREAALAQQRQFENALKTFMAETGRMNAITAAGGGGQLGVGQAAQIGSGPNNEPVFRQKNGQLFTYDASGQPMPYAGQVLPRVSTAQPTEDERKAAGWFFQADTARRNMQAAISTDPAASMPTVAERGAGMLPKIGEDVANSMRPEARQRFVQAASSFAEATLRAATGAGVNESEAIQKVRELTPQLGDKPETIKQKIAAQEMYLASLRTRAGRALPQAGSVLPGAPGADSDPLGLRR